MLRNLSLSCVLALSAMIFPAHAQSEMAGTALASDVLLTADSCFAHIDSNLYMISDQLPRYVEEIEVGDINPAGYDVEIRYPEYKTLSNKELRLVKDLQKAGTVPADAEVDADALVLRPYVQPTGGLTLEQYMAVSRKQGFLNISFCPIVRHEGQWKRILSCQIRVTAKGNGGVAKAPSKTEAQDRWTNQSVLSSGTWAKIRVSKEGIYQLTADDIQKMGFSNLANIKVYGYGGLIQDEAFSFPDVNESVLQTVAPDDLEEVPLMTTSDGRRLFWAEGTIRYKWNTSTSRYSHILNHYSKYSYYFITEGNSPASPAMLDEVTEDSRRTLTTVPYAVVLDNDTYSWYSGGRRMFDSHEFASNSTNSYRVATPSLDATASGTKSIEVSFGASSTLKSTQVKISANGNSVGSMNIERYDASNSSANVQLTVFNGINSLYPYENNLFQFTTTQGMDARLDFVRINYPRTLELYGDPYAFAVQGDGVTTLQIGKANAHTHLWRIGQAGSPTAEVPVTLENDTLLVAKIDAPTRRYVFFDDTQTYESPEFVSTIANQNLHADSNIDYIIIVPESGKLVEQADRLGKLHAQHDGYTYRVVRADELYNEFSSGTPDANAYRRYLKMLYDRAGYDTKALPKFCLMLGKAPWDSRCVTKEWSSKKPEDYLLAYEVDGATSSIGSVFSYVTDDFFGMLDDGEGTFVRTEKLDLALGRMVCVTEEEAKRLVDKVEVYMSNRDAGGWKNTIALLADNGNSNEHMIDTERVADVFKKYAPNLNLQKVYWDRYTWTSSATGYTFPQATARILDLMKEGASVFNYSGHGSPTLISHYKVLKASDFATPLSPYMPLWVLASCEIYPFDSEEENLAEVSLFAPDGGSIAFMCATRSVYATQNNRLNTAYCRYLFNKDTEGRRISMGEALRLAKIYMLDGSESGDPGINKLKYVFFGDPALPLAVPTGTVVLDSINGVALNPSDPVDFGASSPRKVAELIKLSAGGIATFSGHVCQLNSNTLIDENFSGTVSATIFDREETITCKNNAKDTDCSPMVFTERSKSIYKGTTEAENGRFTFSLTIPRDISYTNDAGRISFYAINKERTTEYNGYSEDFCLNGTAPMAEADTLAPKVVAYINSIDNPDYTITDENPVLIADISDDCGINNAGISLGHDIELVLDGNISEYINLNSYFTYDFGSYQKGQLVYNLTGMSKGTHTAQLRVWDVNNNYTSTDVHFIVRSEASGGENENGYITATKNPAVTDTRFITYFPANAEMDGLVTYEVYDTRGRCVYKEPVAVGANATSATFGWDLCGNDHQPLPSGVYFYRAVITTANGVKETDAQKLIISRQ